MALGEGCAIRSASTVSQIKSNSEGDPECGLRDWERENRTYLKGKAYLLDVYDV